MDAFIADNKLPERLTTREARQEFLHYYSYVIEDFPFIFVADENQQLCTNCRTALGGNKRKKAPECSIAGVTVEKIDINPEQAHIGPGKEFVFQLRWTALPHNSREKTGVFDIDFVIEKD